MSEPEWNGVTWSTFIKPQVLTALERLLSKPGVTVLYGPQGCGKTTAAMLVAQKLGLQVIEIDESKIKQREARKLLLKELGMKSFIKKLYLYDTVNAFIPWGLLYEMSRRTAHPILIIYSEQPNIPKNALGTVNFVEFPRLKRREVIEYMQKRFGPEINTALITTNLRETILALKYSSEPSSHEDVFTELDKIFSGQRNIKWNDSLWVWVVEHIDDFFSGRNLFLATRFVSNVELAKFPELLPTLARLHPKNPMYVRYRYPYLFRRMKALAGGEENE